MQVDVEFTVGGLSETALYVMSLTRKEVTAPHMLLVSDNKGRICHATSTLAERLGTTVSQMQAGKTMHALENLMSPPFTKIHHQVCPDHGWGRERDR